MKRAAIICLLLTSLCGYRMHAQPLSVSDTLSKENLADTGATEKRSAIKGNLKDERGNPVVAAYVACISGDSVYSSCVTDFDGNYAVYPPAAGKWNIRFSFQAKELTITEVSLAEGSTRTIDATLTISNIGYRYRPHSCRFFRSPLIDASYPGGHVTYSGDMLW